MFEDPLPPDASTVDDMDIDLDIGEDELEATTENANGNTVCHLDPLHVNINSRSQLGLH